jgi:pSer/pThr/pTyr-binding forkhead associated (FHA) protein
MFLVMFILLIATRHQLAKLSAPAREAIGKRAAQVRDQVRKTLLGGASHQQQAVAYLNVLVARSDRVGSKIEIYNNRTTLGRDPSLTDVQLYNPEDKTSVSGLHCTIFYDPGQGKFFITDDNSTNGSFLNGKRLPSNEPHELKENDEITLGDIYRQGAKLRFELAAGQPAHSIEDEMIPIENDFNVDLDGSGSYANEVTQAAVDSMPPPPPPQPKKEMSDETIPGYRDEDILSYPEQPAAPPPGRPANKPPQKKGKDKSWIDDLS